MTDTEATTTTTTAGTTTPAGTTSSSSSTITTINEAREEVSKCDQEIQLIKSALRGIGSSSSSSSSSSSEPPNELKIVFTKVDGLSGTVKEPVLLSLQLSSPIENGTISVGETISFSGVETSVAIITIDAKKNNNNDDNNNNDSLLLLGSSSDPIEVAPLCALDDPKNPKNEYITDVSVSIVSSSPTKESETEPAAADAVTSSSDDGAATTEKEKTSTTTETTVAEEKEKTTTSEQPVVVCTLTLKVSYKPSKKDQREELFELLNKTSQRKATALTALRELSTMTPVSGGYPSSKNASAGGGKSSTGTSSSTSNKNSSSVKPGFLNKDDGGAVTTVSRKIGDKNNNQKKKGGGYIVSNVVKNWYERVVTGPESIVRKVAYWTAVTKDYWIFFGAVGFFHFRGQVLALPPPV